MNKHVSASPACADPEARTAARPLPHEVIGMLPPEIARHRVLDVRETAALIGFSVPQVRRLYREGRMPKPLKLGSRKCGWRLGDLLDWLESRAAA